MRLESVLVVGVVLLGTATGTAVAMDNTAPFAEAGLDQTVPPNTTVYLDANGSTDPDGSVAAVEWTVRNPDGRTDSPDCVDCRRTHFEATTVGQYTVTLTVTDDDGATSSDRLHVTVASDAGPTVTLSGPSAATPNRDTTMTADVSKAEAGLQSLAWVVNGSVVAQRDIGGDSASESMTHSFDGPGSKSVSAVVYDSLGNRGTASHTVLVAPAVASTSGDNSGGDAGGDLCHEPSGLCGNGADKIITKDGVTTVIDSNGKPGIQLFDGGEIADYGRNLYELDITSTGLNSDDTLIVEAGKLDDITTEDYETGGSMNRDTTDTGVGTGDNGSRGGDDSSDSYDSDSGDAARKFDGSGQTNDDSSDNGDSGYVARKFDGSNGGNSSGSSDSGSNDSNKSGGSFFGGDSDNGGDSDSSSNSGNGGNSDEGLFGGLF